MFWDVDHLEWGQDGCEYSAESSDRFTTVCHCQHLTNFGVMMDYMGTADHSHSELSALSYVVLSISCLAIISSGKVRVLGH